MNAVAKRYHLHQELIVDAMKTSAAQTFPVSYLIALGWFGQFSISSYWSTEAFGGFENGPVVFPQGAQMAAIASIRQYLIRSICFDESMRNVVCCIELRAAHSDFFSVLRR